MFMDKIDEVLSRGVANVYPSKQELEKVLRSGKKIRLYNGIDPTGNTLHLGHMVVLRKLRQFQDLGHGVIMLIGDFTGMIGDPSGKSETRKPLTREQVLENAKNYKEQASKILRFEGGNPAEIKYNSEWLDKLSYSEVANIASLLTYAQVIERDMFQKRIKEGKDHFLSEFLYPLMQGYDSVAMDVDLEVGGSDQTFNMLTGRDLMKKMKGKEKFVLTTKLLAEPGKEKMSKTGDNFISLVDKPNDIYGKIMSWPDEMINLGYELLTDVSPENISPMNQKKKLAAEIIKQLYSLDAAQKAQHEFERVFQEKEIPSDNLPEYQITLRQDSGQASQPVNIIDLLVDSQLVTSRSEAKRLIEQGAVDINNSPISNIQSPISLKNGSIIKVGKRKFVKIKIK